ncbi:MAG: hypothetical protein ACN6OP_03460 [Pseudomonadales bacterium]
MSRPHLRSCGALSGRSPKTGLRVASRHCWTGGAWGKGTCEFCGRTLDEVLAKRVAEPGGADHLARSIENRDLP